MSRYLRILVLKAKFKPLMSVKLNLPSGGSIVIDQTEAFSVYWY